MATEVVLDASALVAFFRDEEGTGAVAKRLSGASITTMNLAEVADALSRRGVEPRETFDAASQLRLEVVDVDAALAQLASELYLPTRRAGLSLGDRMCLALAKRSGRPALTSDRGWRDLPNDLGIEVELFR